MPCLRSGSLSLFPNGIGISNFIFCVGWKTEEPNEKSLEKSLEQGREIITNLTQICHHLQIRTQATWVGGKRSMRSLFL